MKTNKNTAAAAAEEIVSAFNTSGTMGAINVRNEIADEGKLSLDDIDVALAASAEGREALAEIVGECCNLPLGFGKDYATTAHTLAPVMRVLLGDPSEEAETGYHVRMNALLEAIRSKRGESTNTAIFMAGVQRSLEHRAGLAITTTEWHKYLADNLTVWQRLLNEATTTAHFVLSDLTTQPKVAKAA